MIVRAEQPGDTEAIDRVNRLAFEQPDEAQIVARLRTSDAFIPHLSIVAEEAGVVVGHILFSRIQLDPPSEVRAISLAPMAVLPDRQRRGIGSELVRRGLEVATDLGEEVVVVVGHPGYYPRFGFEPARTFGLTNPFPGTEDAFFALTLRPGVRVPSGEIVYPPEFMGEGSNGER